MLEPAPKHYEGTCANYLDIYSWPGAATVKGHSWRKPWLPNLNKHGDRESCSWFGAHCTLAWTPGSQTTLPWPMWHADQGAQQLHNETLLGTSHWAKDLSSIVDGIKSWTDPAPIPELKNWWDLPQLESTETLQEQWSSVTRKLCQWLYHYYWIDSILFAHLHGTLTWSGYFGRQDVYQQRL